MNRKKKKKEAKNQKTILIIDDNEHLITAIGDYLKIQGFEILYTCNYSSLLDINS